MSAPNEPRAIKLARELGFEIIEPDETVEATAVRNPDGAFERVEPVRRWRIILTDGGGSGEYREMVLGYRRGSFVVGHRVQWTSDRQRSFSTEETALRQLRAAASRRAHLEGRQR